MAHNKLQHTLNSNIMKPQQYRFNPYGRNPTEKALPNTPKGYKGQSALEGTQGLSMRMFLEACGEEMLKQHTKRVNKWVKKIDSRLPGKPGKYRWMAADPWRKAGYCYMYLFKPEYYHQVQMASLPNDCRSSKLGVESKKGGC